MARRTPAGPEARSVSAVHLGALGGSDGSHGVLANGLVPPAETLLDEGGHLARPVSAEAVAAWKREVKSAHPAPLRAAQLHLWLGEWELAHNQEPEQALWHFRAAQRDARPADAAFGLAAYDRAITLYLQGAYAEAEPAFRNLLKARFGGYDRRNCALWWRHASACAGYHAEHAKLGIRQPTSLDPLCGVGGLAACLRDLHRPYDKATLLRACRVTGLGNSVQDLVDACPKLGVVGRAINADDQGLMALPKPMVAYVEHDHFVAVVRADRRGVSYLCTDCGCWPGGRINLSWQQWRAMDSGPYVSVVEKNSRADRALAALLDGKGARPAMTNSVRVASLGQGIGLGALSAAEQQIAPLLRQFTGHVFLTMTAGQIVCGNKPVGLTCTPGKGAPPNDASGPVGTGAGLGGALGGALGSLFGATVGEPVNLATGEEEYTPPADLSVYNPAGPSVVWSRVYRSLRGPSSTYESDDFGVGWTQPYNMFVDDPSGAGAMAAASPTGTTSTSGTKTTSGTTSVIGPGPTPIGGPSTATKYLVFANGGRVSITPPAVPSATQPQVACTVERGVPVLVTWNYSSSNAYGYYTITFPDRSKWTTNTVSGEFFQVGRVTDRNGNGLSFTYTSTAGPAGFLLLSSIRDLNSSRVLLTINRASDGKGNITSVADCYGRSVYYHVGTYNCVGVSAPFPTSYQEVDSVSQVVATGAANRPARCTLGYQSVSNTEGAEQVPFLHTITVPSPTGTGTATATINYDPATDFVSSVVDANGNSRVYTSVDANHTKVTVKDAQNNVISSYTVGYNGDMNETSRTDGNGTLIQSRAYGDANDPYRPSTVTDGTNKTWSYTWDSYGNLKTATTPRGVTTTRTWDYSAFALGRLTSVQQGSRTPTTFAYLEPRGLIQSVSGPSPTGTGTVTASYTYDGLGNVLTVTRPGNNAVSTITTTYNYTQDGAYTQAAAIGQPLTVTDNRGKVSHFRYNARGLRTVAVDALGNETDYAYNLADQTQSVTLPATGQTGTGHGSKSLAYLYPGGPATSGTVYNESGTAVRQVNYAWGPEGELRSRGGSTEPVTYTYDGAYRPKTLTDGNNHATTYNYNTAGYLSSVVYPGGDTVQYPSYDAAGRLLQRIDAKGVTTNYLYNDPDGLLSDAQYPSSTGLNVHRSRDSLGRLSSVADGASSFAYAYNDANAVTSVTTGYAGLTGNQVISYGYYPNGSRQTMSTPAGGFTYNYDENGRLTNLSNPLGESTSWTYLDNGWAWTQQRSNSVTTTNTLNALGQRTDIATRTSGGALLSDFGGMAYDGAGNRVSLTANLAGAPALSGTTSYAYDTKNQLTQEQSARNGGYTFGFGYDSAGNPTTFKGQGRTFNVNNQQNGNTYDGAGNPTTYQGTSFTFDAKNRLTGVGNLLSCGYTAGGLRAWKQNSAGQRTYFLYSDGTPVCELDSAGNVLAVNTFGAWGLVSRHTGSGSVFYTFDPQGGTAQRLDGNGNVLSSSGFDAFGGGTAAANDSFGGYGAQWGYYRDTETGLQLLGYRYYDAGTGRFVNRDPIGYAGGVNVYAYTRNNPVRGVDPSGLQEGEGEGEIIIGPGGEPTVKPIQPIVDPIGGSGDGEGEGGGPISPGPPVNLGGDPLNNFQQEPSSISSVGTPIPGAQQPGGGPGFAVTPGGDVIPIPQGASGPVGVQGQPPSEPPGFGFIGGSGGNGLSPRANGVRIMDPREPIGLSPGYPNDYCSYFNITPDGNQTINPYTGRTIGRSDPSWHIPLSPPQ